jgi:hypothetical protein
MIGKFLQGAYIPKIIHVCITYNNNSNSSIEPVSAETIKSYNKMLNDLSCFSFNFSELFPNLPKYYNFVNENEFLND